MIRWGCLCALLIGTTPIDAFARQVDPARELRAQSVSRLFSPTFDAVSLTGESGISRPSLSFLVSDANKLTRANFGVLFGSRLLAELRFEAPSSAENPTIASTVNLPSKARAEARGQVLIWDRVVGPTGSRMRTAGVNALLNSQERSRPDLAARAVRERIINGDVRPTDGVFLGGSLGRSQLNNQFVTNDRVDPQPGQITGRAWSVGGSWVRTKVACVVDPETTLCKKDPQGNDVMRSRPGYLFSITRRKDDILSDGKATEICQAVPAQAATRCDARTFGPPTATTQQQTALQFHYWADDRYAMGVRYIAVSDSPEWTFDFPLTVLILVDDAHADQPTIKPKAGIPQLSGAVTAGWVRDKVKRQFVVTVTFGTTFELPRLLK